MPLYAFDLGETLATYEGIPLSWVDHYRPALTQAANAAGLTLDGAALDHACATLARYNTRITPRDHEVSSREILAAALGPQAIAVQEAFERNFFSYFQRSCQAYPETAHALQALRQQGQKIAVLTDVPYGMPRDFVLADLRSAGIEGLVDILLTSVETGWRKPRSEGFQALAQALGVPVGGLSFVGNEKKDIEGIQSVGGQGILIDRGAKRPVYGQDRSITSLMELLA